MRKYSLFLTIIFLVASATYVIKSCKVVDALRQEVAMHQRNEKAFVNDIKRYKTDAGNAGAKVGELQLRLDNALQALGESKQTIKELGLKVKNMESAGKATIKTEYKVIERLKTDTVYQSESTGEDSAEIKYVDVLNPFYDVHAVIVHDTINMDIVTRDSLLLVETVTYKRFLGFLWKTKRIKSRTFDLISRNPNTIIEDFRVVTVRK